MPEFMDMHGNIFQNMFYAGMEWPQYQIKWLITYKVSNRIRKALPLTRDSIINIPHTAKEKDQRRSC
jgi:hypothetical protein